MDSISPTVPRECQAAGWRGDWSCCCRRVPQTALEGLFVFEKILLFNPAAPYMEGPVLSLSPSLLLDQECPGQGPTWPSSQLSPTGLLRQWSSWVNHLSLFPSLRLQATRSLSGCCSTPVWQGRGLLPPLSQESCCRPCGMGLGLQLPWSPHWSPHWSPYWSQGLFVLKQSHYRLFFQCPLYFLVSYFLKRWGTVGCLLCSSPSL